VTHPPTPSQTIGPFFAVGICWPDGPDVVGEDTPGARRIGGRVLDGAGDPVPDALIETWQADPQGRFAHPDDPRGPVSGGFRGFGRCPTDAQGRWAIRTLKPGRVPGPDGKPQAPHLTVTIFMRGLLKQLQTRMYFPDDTANADDAVLKLVPAERRATLVAKKRGDGVLEWNVVLQGKNETVFFDF